MTDVTRNQVWNVMTVKLRWPYQNMHIKENFSLIQNRSDSKLQSTSNVFALWDFLMTFHSTSMKDNTFLVSLKMSFSTQ
jgi:hypothetical protein